MADRKGLTYGEIALILAMMALVVALEAGS